MRPKRFFFVMLGGFCLTILLILGATFAGNSFLQNSSKKLVDLKVQDRSIDEQERSLAQAKKDIEKYKNLNDIAKSVVPQDKDQAKTIRGITQIAEQSGIKLKAFVFSSSTLGQTPVATPKTADDSSKSGTTTPAIPPLTQVKPVDGISGVYAYDVTISPVDKQPIPYNKFLEFLERLESNRRTAHVDKISVTPTENGVTFSLTLKAYVKP